MTRKDVVNLVAKTMQNIPQKHIGIYSNGHVYHYSNSTGFATAIQLGLLPLAGFAAPGLSKSDLSAAFDSVYADAYFIRRVEGTPRVAAVNASNFADIGMEVRGGSACVLVAIDNLVKGMAGQAVQNLNIAKGWDEHTGLEYAGLFPA